MTDDRYLWDKTGPPDPEVERLEQTLASLAHDEAPLALPPSAVKERPLAERERAVERGRREPLRPPFSRWLPFGVAAFSAAAVIIVVAVIAVRAPRGWEVRA